VCRVKTKKVWFGNKVLLFPIFGNKKNSSFKFWKGNGNFLDFFFETLKKQKLGEKIKEKKILNPN
jgi:hypothetical protein